MKESESTLDTSSSLKNKIFEFDSWDYLGYDRVEKISGVEILNRYWDVWRKMMISRYGLDSYLITENHCITAWLIMNSAREVNGEKRNL